MSLSVLKKKTFNKVSVSNKAPSRSSSGRISDIRNKCGRGVFFSLQPTASEYTRQKKLKHINEGNICNENNTQPIPFCNHVKDLSTKTTQEYINNKIAKCASIEGKPQIPNRC